MDYLFSAYIFVTIAFLWMVGFTTGYFVALYYEKKNRDCSDCYYLDDQYLCTGIECVDGSQWKKKRIWHRKK